jgi:hypothetical protein
MGRFSKWMVQTVNMTHGSKPMSTRMRLHVLMHMLDGLKLYGSVQIK